ncbi:MAG TPA: galactitol-1-phosphate 5-dehydrogenase [Bacteroidales bacterium]|nr:galactitol-1-phosphate 5-dehydrogenase [Bacteroidales bacterium]
MKALVLEDYKKMVYKDMPEPVIGDKDVLVRVKACGICGSDIHGYDGSTGRRIPPLVMGHEASGVVEKTGTGVKSWKAGDRVTFDSTVYPLNDWFTLEGSYNLSDNREVLGVSPGTYRRDGAFAEFVAVPEHILYRIPETVTFEQAAMVEGIAVALHAVRIAGLKTGERCVVIGAGMIGISVIKLLAVSGASQIIVVDTNPVCLDKALKAGATAAFRAEAPGLVTKIISRTKNRGADISFEVVGKTESVNLAIETLRKGGRTVLIGNVSPEIDFPLQKVVTRELSILGSCAIRGEYETVLELMESGKIGTDDQVMAVAPLSEGAEWFGRLYSGKGGSGKVILVP